jgi:hypothetical protein
VAAGSSAGSDCPQSARSPNGFWLSGGLAVEPLLSDFRKAAEFLLLRPSHREVPLRFRRGGVLLPYRRVWPIRELPSETAWRQSCTLDRWQDLVVLTAFVTDPRR